MKTSFIYKVSLSIVFILIVDFSTIINVVKANFLVEFEVNNNDLVFYENELKVDSNYFIEDTSPELSLEIETWMTDQDFLFKVQGESKVNLPVGIIKTYKMDEGVQYENIGGGFLSEKKEVFLISTDRTFY